MKKYICGFSALLLAVSLLASNVCLVYGADDLQIQLEEGGFEDAELKANADTSDKTPYAVTGGSIYFDKTTGEITSCDKNVTIIEIPEEIDGVSVTGIADSAFCYSKLTEVSIPKTVTKIGDYVFNQCPDLKSVAVDSQNTAYKAEDGVLFNSDMTELVLYPPKKEGTSYTVPESVSSLAHCAFTCAADLTEVKLPEGITSINLELFHGCTSLQKVNIPDGVKSIMKNAFKECESLTSITLPENLTFLGEEAFSGCVSLTSINIPAKTTTIYANVFYNTPMLEEINVAEENNKFKSADGVLFNVQGTKLIKYPSAKPVTSYKIPEGVTSMEANAFNKCALTSVETPASLTVIPACAFMSSPNLTTVVINEGCIEMEQRAFYGCPKLKSVSLPAGLTAIGQYDFQGCEALTDINFPRGLTTIGGWAFCKCSALGKVEIPDTVTELDNYVFSECDNLTDVSLSEGLKKIGASCFYKCSLLESIHIPDSVTEISWQAFEYCEGLKSVNLPLNLESIGDYVFRGDPLLEVEGLTIPAGVKSIGAGIFADCDKITEIKTDPANEYFTVQDGVLFTKDMTKLVCYPSGKKGEYKIPNTVTELGQGAFLGAWGLNSVTISDGITSIDRNAFTYCSNLTTVIIPDSVTEISGNAFIFSGVTTIYCNPGSYAEQYANEKGYYVKYIENTLVEYELTGGSIVFDKTAKTIISADGTITEAVIPSQIDSVDVEAIGKGVFLNSEKLTRVQLPEGLKIIGSKAFYGCKNLRDINFPESLAEIFSYAFYGCDSIVSVELPKGVNNLSGIVFNNMAELETIKLDINQKVLYIGCVSSNPKLKNVTIGENVEQLADMFTDCPSLEEITLPSALEKISGKSFENCTGLKKVVIPDSVLEIDDEVFTGCNFDILSIYCSKYSYAAKFARQKGIRIVYPDGTVEEPKNNDDDNTGDGTEDDKNETPGEDFDIDEELGILNGYNGNDAVIFIPDDGSVKIIGENAFTQTSAEEVIIPESVEEIAGNAFDGGNKDIVIFCYEASAAEEYAKSSELNYAVLGDADNDKEVTHTDAELILKLVRNSEDMSGLGEYEEKPVKYLEKDGRITASTVARVIKMADK